MIRIGATEEHILKTLSSSISDKLDSIGIFNRVFSRIKSKSSIEKKLSEKSKEYAEKGKKMQDVFGIRVTVYFMDDENIAINLVKQTFLDIPESHSIDKLTKDQFGPVRKNFVFRINENLSSSSAIFDNEFIDSTFEVQFRTVFSEGWHEVEHDLRYKCKDDWMEEDVLSRQLNGQLAALETSDWALLRIFDELAYKKYKQKEWNSFFRNILRIRFEDLSFSDKVLKIMKGGEIAKELLKRERAQLIGSLTKVKSKLPLKMDNVLLILNREILQKREIYEIESPFIKQILDSSFK